MAEAVMADTYLLIAALVVASGSLLLNIYLIGKAKWMIASIERLGRRNDHSIRHLFRHLQILQGLHADLKLAHPLPPTGGKAGSPDFLKAVADHILTTKPRAVVECGSGVSTVVIARCLQLNGVGHIVTMEHMPEFAAMTRVELERQDLSKWATVLDAPLVMQELLGKTFRWYDASRLPAEPIDLLIIDGPPARTGDSPRYPAGPRLFPRLSENGAIFIDDAKRPEERGVIERWRKQFKHLHFEFDEEQFQKGICIVRAAKSAEVTALTTA
jgi:predicted O-methyltransferase YrrM